MPQKDECKRQRGSEPSGSIPIIRSPALAHLEQATPPPARQTGRVASAVAESKPGQRKRSPSGTLNQPRRASDKAAGANSGPLEVSIPLLPKEFGRPDYKLLAAVCGLLCFGLVMVYSASTAAVLGDPSYWFRRELLWGGLGLVALFTSARIPYDRWRRLSIVVMFGALALLLLVLLVGKTINGAQRWLPIGSFFSFQPSELAKLAFILYIADWLSRKGEQVRTFTYGLVPFAILTGVVLGFVMLQNDLGTALIIAAFAVAMFITAGANLLHLLPMTISGILTFGLITLTTPFRAGRLQAFLDPLNCLARQSYQVCQGLIALGSGGISGIGLGASRQKAGYLPNPWTDSIFAIIGEELGFIGCFIIIVLLLIFAYRALRVGRRAPDMYGTLLATGITCWIVVQAVLNIGSVIALIPFTGVPLPFISFGGSSLVTTMAAVGILLNISRYTSTWHKQPSSLGTDHHAGIDLRRRDGGAHLPRPGRR